MFHARTDARSRVLRAICALTDEAALPPSQAEIGRRAGLSSGAVQYHLRILCLLGYLVLTHGVHRGIQVTLAGRRADAEASREGAGRTTGGTSRAPYRAGRLEVSA